jgi:transcription elongation factor
VNILDQTSSGGKLIETPIITEVSAESLSKVFYNGDLVKIIYGENINMTGRVVRQEGDYIYILNLE